VTPRIPRKTVEAIGNRKVGNGVNLFSLEREISLGKGLAQEVERSSKMIDDPLVTEICQPRGAEPGPQLRCKSSVHHQGHRFG